VAPTTTNPPWEPIPTTDHYYIQGHPATNRRLGALARAAAPGTLAPLLADRHPLVNQKEWYEFTAADHAGAWRDQGGQGSCVGFAGTKVLYVSARSLGIPYPELSAGHLYGNINGGRDNGAWLSDALIHLMHEGVCSTELVPDLEWRYQLWPDDAPTDAKRHRITEFYDCPDWPQIASALQMGFMVAAAIDIGNSFALDDDAWVHPKRGSSGGHALALVGMAYNPARKTWGAIALNSWSANRYWARPIAIPADYFDGTYNDAWAVRVTTDPTPKPTPLSAKPAPTPTNNPRAPNQLRKSQ